MSELVPVKQEEDHANVTPDSSATANSKSDLDNSLLPLQVSLKSCLVANIFILNFIFKLNNACGIAFSDRK